MASISVVFTPAQATPLGLVIASVTEYEAIWQPLAAEWGLGMLQRWMSGPTFRGDEIPALIGELKSFRIRLRFAATLSFGQARQICKRIDVAVRELLTVPWRVGGEATFVVDYAEVAGMTIPTMKLVVLTDPNAIGSEHEIGTLAEFRQVWSPAVDDLRLDRIARWPEEPAILKEEVEPLKTELTALADHVMRRQRSLTPGHAAQIAECVSTLAAVLDSVPWAQGGEVFIAIEDEDTE